MVRLTREDAGKQLDAWWRRIERSKVPRQRIIHVLKPFADEEFNGRPAYDTWCRGGVNATTDSLALTQKDAGTALFIEDGLKAADNGTRHTRIFFASQADFGDSPTPQRYVAEVLYSFFAAKIGEIVWMVPLEDYVAAGFSVRDVDVSIYGVAGILRNRYGADGKIAEREFLSWWRHPWLTFRERRFVLRVERFARRHGTRIQPATSS